MKNTALRMLLGLSLLAAVGACSAQTPPLPTEPEKEEPPPPNTGFRTVATPAIYA